MIELEQLAGIDATRNTAPHRTKCHSAAWHLGRGKTGREVADFLGVSTTTKELGTEVQGRGIGWAGQFVHGRGKPKAATEVQRRLPYRQSPRPIGLTQTPVDVPIVNSRCCRRCHQSHHPLQRDVGGLEAIAQSDGLTAVQTRPEPHLGWSTIQKLTSSAKKGPWTRPSESPKLTLREPGPRPLVCRRGQLLDRQPTQARLAWASTGRRQPKVSYLAQTTNISLMRVVGLMAPSATARVHVWDVHGVTVRPIGPRRLSVR